jgi:hypothetical protein
MNEKEERVLCDMVSYVDKVDRINRGLVATVKMSLITVMVICLLFAVVVIFRDHAYFFSEVVYPEVSQEVNQSDGDSEQEVKQNFK